MSPPNSSAPGDRPESSIRRVNRPLLLAAFLLLPIVVVSGLVWLVAGAPAAQLTAGILLIGALLLLAAWLLGNMVRAFLWRVGRRLAFSYFLIGVLPIPMVAFLIGVNAYLLAGYFLGHLYRDANTELHEYINQAALTELARPDEPRPENLVFARYRDGRRVSGDDRLPGTWPAWMATEEGHAYDGFVALRDGTPTVIAAAGSAERGVVTLFKGSLSAELSRRSDVWIELYRADDPDATAVTRLNFLGREFALLPVTAKRLGGRDEFFGIAGVENPDLFVRPVLWWGELAGSVRSIEDGEQVSDYVMASLNGTLGVVTRHLFSGSAEVDTAIWALAISATVVLGSFYAVALMMALFIIFTLSRAVNRLSKATDAVRRGDFSTRIPVRRRDQIGELQRSFNQMTANLEQLVVSEAQKEALEKELRVARDLQQSLLPADLPDNDQLEFATLFEPSAAIGGDYFDVLHIDKHRLAVVVADVSGHGLPTGLRMAMLKAALVILVEESKAPIEILARLDEMVRAERRTFVTATIGIVDYRRGELQLTNAGHPPTYLVREGEVEEILLPGNPLGTLGKDYGHRRVDLCAGDHIVWLSDGLVEATNGTREPFGYDRVRQSLAKKSTSAADLRDALVTAVASHTGDTPPDDDRTLVVMRFKSAKQSPAAD